MSDADPKPTTPTSQAHPELNRPADPAPRKAPRQRIVEVFKLDPETRFLLPGILRQETVGGVVMLVATVIALLWANLGGASYEAVRGFQIGPLDVQHWAADGLLAIFFFVAGLELKREFVSGSLSRPAEALVPIISAICGMIVPAGLYLLVNTVIPGGNTHGWAIPMATDIAFAVAILAAVGSGLPASLRAFLLTLAIVDDLGAIAVIAVVFTSSLNFVWLAIAAACALLWWGLQRRRIDGWWWYVPLFILTWWALHQSGVHATIAGVALGLLSRSEKEDPADPVDRWEHFMRPFSAGLIVPIFALTTAGVAINPEAMQLIFTSPIGLGIVCGLVLGKPIGIFGGAWLTTKLSKARLAADLRWIELWSMSVLAGVGFTVSLFVSELAFAGQPELVEQAKAAVLTGSVIAAVLATFGLRRRLHRRRREAVDHG